MSEATVIDIKEMIPELEDVDSGTISLYLIDAKAMVEADGFGTTDTSFSILQRYMAAHLMQNGGILAANVTSEQVGDVSIQYESGDASATNKWENLYNHHKTRISGLCDRIL